MLAHSLVVVVACLWDYDTLKEEALGQPEVVAAVTGDLGKHSPAFYAAKVDYTRALVDTGSAPKERYDDLAVALAKTGKLDAAIATLTVKEQRFPGEYTTEANLGTFLAMKGDVKAALDRLKQAIAINPDAHFGREKFQIQLLEYTLRVQQDPTLPERENFLGLSQDVFKSYIHPIGTRASTRKKGTYPTPKVVALVGLIRFGDAHENPHVWFALGWALAEQGDVQLAVRALRRAELAGHPKAAEHGGQLAAFSTKLNKGDNPSSPATMSASWARVKPLADADWKKGQATQLARQKREDAKISRKQHKAAFGY